jgi:hypothetical protein
MGEIAHKQEWTTDMARFIKIPSSHSGGAKLINVETIEEVSLLKEGDIEIKCRSTNHRLRGGTLDQLLNILHDHNQTTLGSPWTTARDRP